jgi:hypothetical protein
VLTATGHVRICRAYYHCRSCGQGECPADAQLGLEGRYSPAVRQMVALAGILQSFGRSEDLLRRLSGLRVSHESARTLTEQQGGQLEARHESSRPVASIEAEVGWDFSLPDREGKSFPGTVAYLGLDAFAVPILDAAGKRAWNMMYVGLLDDPRKEHTIYLTGYDQRSLAEQMRAYAIGFRLGTADRVVALTDGGNGLEGALSGHFGGKVEFILDFWHASEHLHAWAKCRYGDANSAAKAWAEEAIGRMRDGGGEALLSWLREQRLPEDVSEAIREEWRKLQGYLENNVHRMNYPEYRRQGLDIGSGPTEAGCKIVGQRLKGAGMKWERPHSSQVAALRALYLRGEGLWDAFFERSEKLAA